MANEHSFGSCSKHNTIVRVMVFNQWPTTIDALFRLWNRNDLFNERLRRKQTTSSNDRKSVSVHDNPVFNDVADEQGSAHAIVVWSGCSPKLIKSYKKTLFVTQNSTPHSKQFSPQDSGDTYACRSHQTQLMHSERVDLINIYKASYYAKLRQIKLICGHV